MASLKSNILYKVFGEKSSFVSGKLEQFLCKERVISKISTLLLSKQEGEELKTYWEGPCAKEINSFNWTWLSKLWEISPFINKLSVKKWRFFAVSSISGSYSTFFIKLLLNSKSFKIMGLFYWNCQRKDVRIIRKVEVERGRFISFLLAVIWEVSIGGGVISPTLVKNSKHVKRLVCH